ncbi:Ldh family oxidoreductase [Blastococcus sp. SYSU D00820]
MPDARRRFAVDALERWTAGVLRAHGMSEDDAALGARVVVDADLSGTETHGLSNFCTHWHYAPGLADGSVNPTARPAVLRESSVTAAWDADRGFGPVVAARAMQAAMDKAEEHGVGMVTVRDGCHLGAAGHYARMAAERGLIGMVMSHTAAAVAPPGGTRPAVGTNPLAVGAPVADRPPFVFDMAVTAAAGTKVQVAAREGRSVPLGWIVDADGRPTTDPTAAAGYLLLGAQPDGSGGHKGFGLGMVVDIVSGVLSGTGSGLFATFGPDWRIGYWLAAWRIDAFVDRAEYDRGMRELADGLHAIPPAEGSAGVLLPGERSAALRAERRSDGVPLDAAVIENCTALGRSVGVPFPDPA